MNERVTKKKYQAFIISEILGIVNDRGGKTKHSKEFIAKYYNDPYQWVSDFVDIELALYHEEILLMIKNGKNKIAIRGPHGLGKSVLAAIVVLWAGSVSSDCKVITTASAWRQLEEYLWPEVHKWHAKTDWKKIEASGGSRAPRLLTLECKFSDQSKAFAVASDNPVTIEGAHAQRIVYIFDESKAIPAGVWESADGAFSTPGDHLQIALSTPGDTSGVYYSICSRQHGYEEWAVRAVTLREAIRSKRISIEWARQKRKAWGKDNAAYQNRVWGVFATDSPDAVIPLAWVEAAVARWHGWRKAGSPKPMPFVIGADTAGQGVDKTVFAYRYGHNLAKLQRYGKSRPMELAGKLKVELGGIGVLNIDTSFGEGVGTADRMKEFPEVADRVHMIQFATRVDATDRTGQLKFKNMRALLWWNMRELLDPENREDVALPDDELLIGDLTAVRRLPITSDGRIQIEPKEDIKKRIGRSPDDGDACCLAFYNAPREAATDLSYVQPAPSFARR
jgi:hypothetical protein